MAIVEKLGKLSHLVACRVGEGQLTAPEVAKLFFKNWVQFFGIPKVVLHDHDACFTAAFWKALWSFTGTQTVFSSVYHS